MRNIKIFSSLHYGYEPKQSEICILRQHIQHVVFQRKVDRFKVYDRGDFMLQPKSCKEDPKTSKNLESVTREIKRKKYSLSLTSLKVSFYTLYWSVTPIFIASLNPNYVASACNYQRANLTVTIFQNNILRTIIFLVSLIRGGSKFRIQKYWRKKMFDGESGSIKYYKVSNTFV